MWNHTFICNNVYKKKAHRKRCSGHLSHEITYAWQGAAIFMCRFHISCSRCLLAHASLKTESDIYIVCAVAVAVAVIQGSFSEHYYTHFAHSDDRKDKRLWHITCRFATCATIFECEIWFGRIYIWLLVFVSIALRAYEADNIYMFFLISMYMFTKTMFPFSNERFDFTKRIAIMTDTTTA